MRKLAILLLICSLGLCGIGAYTIAQSVGLVRLPPPSLGLFLRLGMYVLVLVWGIVVIYGANTLPERRMIKFTRFATGFEVTAARIGFTVLGIGMVILSILWLHRLFGLP
jgi:hypothetical protein